MKNKRKYIVWFHKNLADEITEMCGSDSIQDFDNRLNNITIIDVVSSSGQLLDFMKRKGAVGFKIALGTILEHKYITDLHMI